MSAMGEHDAMGQHDDKVTAALHAITAGGQGLVMQARQRLAKIMNALDEGDFREAFNATRDLIQSLQPLANAQIHVAVAEGSRLVEARHLEVGMVLTDVGEVSDVNVRECVAETCSGHVKITIGAHEMEYQGDTELYVKNDEPAE